MVQENREVLDIAGVDLRLELKEDYYQERPRCPDCDSDNVHKHGRPNMLSSQIGHRPQDSWYQIVNPLIQRYLCREDGLTFRIGPHPDVGLWARPLLSVIYSLGFSTGKLNKFVNTLESISYASIWRSATGWSKGSEYYDLEIQRQIKELHHYNSGKDFWLRGRKEFTPNSELKSSSSYAWLVQISGSMTSQTLRFIENISTISSQRIREGALLYQPVLEDPTAPTMDNHAGWICSRRNIN